MLITWKYKFTLSICLNNIWQEFGPRVLCLGHHRLLWHVRTLVQVWRSHQVWWTGMCCIIKSNKVKHTLNMLTMNSCLRWSKFHASKFFTVRTQNSFFWHFAIKMFPWVCPPHKLTNEQWYISWHFSPSPPRCLPLLWMYGCLCPMCGILPLSQGRGSTRITK